MRETLRRFFDFKFLKSQAASLAATVVDAGTLFLLTENFHVYYVISVACGAFLGAVTNFTIGRFWAFDAAGKAAPTQIARYATVSLGSLLLNTGGVMFFTEIFGIHYGYSKAIVAILVGILYNYPLQRFFVFK